MARMTGMMMKVTTVRRQEAANMNTSTMTAWVTLRNATFRLRHTWSETVVVSAASLQTPHCQIPTLLSHSCCFFHVTLTISADSNQFTKC